jgi:hypothetical protein
MPKDTFLRSTLGIKKTAMPPRVRMSGIRNCLISKKVIGMAKRKKAAC